jgi:hypothetical protein
MLLIPSSIDFHGQLSFHWRLCLLWSASLVRELVGRLVCVLLSTIVGLGFYNGSIGAVIMTVEGREKVVNQGKSIV